MIPERAESAPLHAQVRILEEALQQSPAVQAVLGVAAALPLPGWYLGAGGVAQTVWNLRHRFDPLSGIKDFDVVYFDPDDLSRANEDRNEAELAGRLSDVGVAIDVKNQARVHLWYERHFGRPIKPYQSAEAAIATWPTTASSVGVRQDDDGFIVCAPFGLSDLLGMVVRPNKTIVTRDVYEEKASRWRAQWPQLRVIPW